MIGSQTLLLALHIGPSGDEMIRPRDRGEHHPFFYPQNKVLPFIFGLVGIFDTSFFIQTRFIVVRKFASRDFTINSM